MIRLVSALIGLTIIAQIAQSDTSSKIDRTLYWPTSVGDTWVYRITLGGKSFGEEKVVVAEVTEKDGVIILSLDQERDGERWRIKERFGVSPKGVYLFHEEESWSKTREPRDCLLRFPVKEGNSWEVVAKERRSLALTEPTLQFKVRKEDELELPVGTLRAVRIDGFAGEMTSPPVITRWFAPGLGIVRIVRPDKEIGDWVKELKSFTSGKK